MQCRFEPLYWCWSTKKCELFVATMKSEQNKKVGISKRKIEGKLGVTILPNWNNNSVMLSWTYFYSKNRISDWHWPRCIWKKSLWRRFWALPSQDTCFLFPYLVRISVRSHLAARTKIKQRIDPDELKILFRPRIIQVPRRCWHTRQCQPALLSVSFVAKGFRSYDIEFS